MILTDVWAAADSGARSLLLLARTRRSRTIGGGSFGSGISSFGTTECGGTSQHMAAFGGYVEDDVSAIYDCMTKVKTSWQWDLGLAWCTRTGGYLS